MVLLILANGFFVAGEFAIVAVERSQVERLTKLATDLLEVVAAGKTDVEVGSAAPITV